MKKLTLFSSILLCIVVQNSLYASICTAVKERMLASFVGAANRDTIKEPSHFTVKNRDRFSALKTDYGYATCENRRGKNQQPAYPNQDRAFAGTILGKEFFAVCDGHGLHGDLVASEVIKVLPEKVLGAKNSQQGFIAACSSLQKFFASVGYAQHSGTTMVGAVIKEKKLIVGHIGDSRLLLVRGGCVVASTQDHSTKNNVECERIKNAGGKILNGYTFSKNAQYGLAVTRSLGDVTAHDGHVVNAQPEIKEYILQDGDYIVLASDGYWDVMTNNETAQLLSGTQSESAKSLAQKLVTCAKNRASRDDITVLVVRYHETK